MNNLLNNNKFRQAFLSAAANKLPDVEENQPKRNYSIKNIYQTFLDEFESDQGQSKGFKELVMWYQEIADQQQKNTVNRVFMYITGYELNTIIEKGSK